jgi:hypothetical protein
MAAFENARCRRTSEVEPIMSDADPRNRPPAADDPPDEIPLGQRLLDRPFLLLVACLVVMFAFYTGWGLWEIASLTPAPLP